MTDKGSLGDTEDLLQAEFCKVPLKRHIFFLPLCAGSPHFYVQWARTVNRPLCVCVCFQVSQKDEA